MKAGLRRWLSAIAAGLLLLVGGIAYLFPRLSAPPQSEPLVLQVSAACQLDLADCRAQDQAGHQLSISLFPRPVPLMQDVGVIVTPQGFPAIHAVEIEIEGVNMFMGQQQAALSASGANWTGSFALPICSKTLMQWQVSLRIKTATTDYQAVFPFSTAR